MRIVFNTLRACILAGLLLALNSTSARAQTWSEVMNDWSATSAGNYGHMLALDQSNNAYVVGSVPWSTILVAKYSPAGAQLWQRVFDNPGSREQGNWITVDSMGNAIVAGRLVSGANNDPNGIVVLKYDPAGTLLWQDVIPSPFAYAQRVVSDDAGNVYVLGRSWTKNASGNTSHDMVTIKYSPSGVREWMRHFGASSTSVDSPAAVAITPAGNVIVTGGTTGSMLMVAYDRAGNQLWSKAVAASTAAIDLAVAGNGDFYAVGGTYSTATGNVGLVIKHDANFNELWRRTYSGVLYGMRVAIDTKGYPIVAGVFNSNGGYLNWVTMKLDPLGNRLWTRTFNQHLYNDEIPYGLVTGPDDSIYVTGQGGPGPISGSLSYLRAATVKYAADGRQVWGITTFDTVRGVGIRLGTDSAAYVIGESPMRLIHYRQEGVFSINPVITPSADTTSGPAPLTVNFTASAGFGTYSYVWEFGDGTLSNSTAPTHVYGAPGAYNATLSVTDAGGRIWPQLPELSINVAAPPPAVPTALVVESSTVVGGRSTQGTVTVSNGAGVVVNLASSSSLARVPATVKIPSGATGASFTVSTSRVRRNTPVTITATANGTTVTTTLTLTAR